MEQSLGFAHFLAQTDTVARLILVVLLVMSVGSWYLIVTKGVQNFLRKRKTAAFLDAFWSAPSLDAVAHQLREDGTREPFSHLVHHGFTAVEQLRAARETGKPAGLIDAGSPDDFLTRALKRAIDEDKARLEYGQTFLATVASSAPFVGLFGTVWGIYHALVAIGMSGQGTLDKVAGPIGEALIMTAIGLAVAIPAAIAYNAFARANRNTMTALGSFAHDVFAFLSMGHKAAQQQGDVAATSNRIIARVVAGKAAPAAA
jgi:biopolymer transport protein ExbB